MINMEKVIKGLEICTKDIPMSNTVHKSDFCKECPYYNAENRYCWNQIVMMRDAIAILKEQQEAVEQKTGHWIYKKCDDMFMCSSCEKHSIRNDYPYCHWCGAKMK